MNGAVAMYNELLHPLLSDNENVVPACLISFYFLWTALRLFRSLLKPSVAIAVALVVAGLLAMKLHWMSPVAASLGICGANSFVPTRTRSSKHQKTSQSSGLLRLLAVVLSIFVDGAAISHLGLATPRRLVFLVCGSLLGLSVLPWLRAVDRLFQLSFYLGIILAMVALSIVIGGGSLALKDEL